VEVEIQEIGSDAIDDRRQNRLEGIRKSEVRWCVEAMSWFCSSAVVVSVDGVWRRFRGVAAMLKLSRCAAGRNFGVKTLVG
jgi:hypothetical protein